MGVLDEILVRKKEEVKRLCSFFDVSRARGQVLGLPPCRDFEAAIRSPGVSVIAEIKKKSPSLGRIADVDVVERLGIYEGAGAAAVSVLTDKESFGGSIADLSECAEKSEVPLLRKDFIIDISQLFQSRLAGADAVLLIAAALSSDKYAELLGITLELGMSPLTEVHNAEELEMVIPFLPPIVGINNRNLHTLKTDLAVTKELASMVPTHAAVVSESGIDERRQIEELKELRVDAFLVGTALMGAKDPAELLGRMCA